MEDSTKITNTVTKQPRFKLSAELNGFPFEVTFRGKAEKLKETVQRLIEAGATPPRANAPATTAAETKTESGPPICPVHQTPMKPSAKPGGFFCSKKAKGGGYCDQTA